VRFVCMFCILCILFVHIYIHICILKRDSRTWRVLCMLCKTVDVCMYIYMHVHVFMYTCTYTYTYLHVYIYMPKRGTQRCGAFNPYKCGYMHVFIYTCTCIYMYMYIYISTCIHIHALYRNTKIWRI